MVTFAGTMETAQLNSGFDIIFLTQYLKNLSNRKLECMHASSYLIINLSGFKNISYFADIPSDMSGLELWKQVVFFPSFLIWRDHFEDTNWLRLHNPTMKISVKNGLLLMYRPSTCVNTLLFYITFTVRKLFLSPAASLQHLIRS